MFSVNVKGTYLASREMIPLMRRAGELPILLASDTRVSGLPSLVAYSATKGALISLAWAMAIDHAYEETRVNSVSPGTIDTPWITRITSDYEDPEEACETTRDRQPHGKLVSPEKITAMAAYLASEEAHCVAGAANGRGRRDERPMRRLPGSPEQPN